MKSTAKVMMTYTNTSDLDTFEIPASITQIGNAMRAAERNIDRETGVLKTVVITITLEKE